MVNVSKERTQKQNNQQRAIVQKGQTVIYQGEEASILDVKPVLTIKVKNKGYIVCGDTLLNEVCLDNV